MNYRKLLRVDRYWPLCVAIIAGIMGCNNDTKMHVEKITNPNSLYFDYKIWGDEESGLVTVNLQYRQGDSEGWPEMVPFPGKVMLDGKTLEPDSSKMNGVYYELNIPVEDFDGQHSIVYAESEDRQYKEEFHFSVIYLNTIVPKTIYRSDLNFELAGLDTLDVIRIIATDTSFYGRGIDRLDSVRNGQVWISKDDLRSLKNGPVYLEFHKEDEWPLKEVQAEGGRLTLSYAVKRVFELQDSTSRTDK